MFIYLNKGAESLGGIGAGLQIIQILSLNVFHRRAGRPSEPATSVFHIKWHFL